MLQLKQATESAIEQELKLQPPSKLTLEGGLYSSLNFLELVPNLEELHLLLCPVFKEEEFQKIATLKNLRVLTIDYAQSLTTLSFVAALSSLKELCITRCTELQDITPITALRTLTHLDLASSGQTVLTHFESLAELTNLEYLDLSNIIFLENLNFLDKLLKIKYLNLNFCPYLSDISALKKLQALEALHLNECHEIEGQLGFILQRKLPHFTPPTATGTRAVTPHHLKI